MISPDEEGYWLFWALDFIRRSYLKKQAQDQWQLSWWDATNW
jgi:hypothetical protein